jgi:hypothetical protein
MRDDVSPLLLPTPNKEPAMFLMTGLEFILGARAFTGSPAASPVGAIAVGRRLVDRQVVDGESPESPFRAGETIYAHSSVAGQRGGFVEHVWSRDGVEVARHYLPIGANRRWRTWSRHRLEAGDYVVEVFAPDGQRLARHAFTSFPTASSRSSRAARRA